MNGRETFMLATLAIIVIFLGIYPAPMIDLLNSSLSHLAEFLQPGAAAPMVGLN
jgi:NADH-quinone oxidoreductase subunit M